MNYSSLKKTISIITNMHTTLNNVAIHFHRGPTATNGTAIYINAGDPNDPVWLGLVEAKATHEAGHIAHTSFEIFEGVQGEKLRKSSMLKWVLNTIEDVRMENCCIAHLPGAYWVFNKMTNLLFEEGYWQEVSDDEPLSMCLQAFLLYAGRGYGVDGQSHLVSKGLYAKQRLIDAGVPSEPLNKIENRMHNWGKLVDTDDAFLEAEMIVRLLQECQQVIQQDQNQGDQGGDAQSGSQGGDQGGDAQSGSQGGKSSGGNPLAFEDLDNMADAFDDIHEQLSQGIDKASDNSNVSDELLNAIQQEYLSDTRSTHSRYFRLDDARQLSRGLTRQLESAMWSKSQQEITYDDTGNEFDQDLLAGVSAGNNRIFFTESEVTTQKSSMIILVDRSGSMNRSDQMLVANNSAAACAYALEAVGIEVGIIHFDNNVTITKKFSDDLNQSMNRMGQEANGGTCTHYALQAAHLMMSQSTRTRKQVLVITDGDPSCIASVEHQVAELIRFGIDVASIQICFGNYAGIENKTVLSSIDELPIVLSDLVSNGALDSIQIG
ncbi:hypothetical protein AYY20_12790 [Photobacterium aquimaris]|uniref:vWA domain-containing protein n=1 Tax=Photobacterium aquimaris TaxID=512643 RepID=UPI0007EFD21A|nr:vWA domain-containing protein [Photobacterium aquimaris]OBU22063.1 hypothetical protein AYY20_12790 [Photobacterium aquimaris]